MDMPDWDAVLAPHFAGRRVILAGGPLAQWTEMASGCRRRGATAVFILGTGSPGTGPQPAPDECETLVVELPDAPTLMERMRLGIAVLTDPPPEATARLDAFDPDRTAIVIGDFLNTAPTLGGRPFRAHRRREWVALEDKVAVDAFWDRADVTRAPCEVVPVSAGEVESAARRVARDGAVVLAGDAREGWHGGASLVRWADSAALLADSVEAIAAHCDLVRVMPYLHGIPCSIHGIVLPDGVAVLRPVEMVVSRKSDGSFFYAGCATFYDPPRDVRDEMRELAGRVGAQLRSEVDFRGAFTVDGIATVDGFRPTELNPRSGAGMTQFSRATGAPLSAILDLVVAGEALPWSASELQDVLLEGADSNRIGGTWSGIHGAEAPATEIALVIGSDGCRAATEGDPVDATLTTGPGHGGTFVRTVFDPPRTPVGSSVGARAAAAWKFADMRFGLGIGELTPATDVHR